VQNPPISRALRGGCILPASAAVWYGYRALGRFVAPALLSRLAAAISGGISDGSDPQSDGAQERVHRAAICVRNVDVHVSCSSHCDTQLAAFFIDPRAKGSTGEVSISSSVSPSEDGRRLCERTALRPDALSG